LEHQTPAGKLAAMNLSANGVISILHFYRHDSGLDDITDGYHYLEQFV
jgi:hypothetical protein